MSSPPVCSSGWEAATSWLLASGWLPHRGTVPPGPPPSHLCRPQRAHRRQHLGHGHWLRGLRRGHQGEEVQLALLLEATIAVLVFAYPDKMDRYAQRELKKGLHLYGTPGTVVSPPPGASPRWTCAAAAFPATPTGSRSTTRHACPTPVTWSSATAAGCPHPGLGGRRRVTSQCSCGSRTARWPWASSGCHSAGAELGSNLHCDRVLPG